MHPGTRLPCPWGCPSAEDWGRDPAEEGHAYPDLLFQAWGTTHPSSLWEGKNPDPQAGGQVHAQVTRQGPAP